MNPFYNSDLEMLRLKQSEYLKKSKQLVETLDEMRSCAKELLKKDVLDSLDHHSSIVKSVLDQVSKMDDDYQVPASMKIAKLEMFISMIDGLQSAFTSQIFSIRQSVMGGLTHGGEPRGNISKFLLN